MWTAKSAVATATGVIFCTLQGHENAQKGEDAPQLDFKGENSVYAAVQQ
jgi:hypothetical protein